jgi:Protein of unknown function (DUF2934)
MAAKAGIYERLDVSPSTARADSAKTAEADINAFAVKKRIEQRAYELYLQRRDQPGSSLDDWLCAEREVLG